MIDFSRIIGSVLRSLYGPNKADVVDGMLEKMETLDQELLQWRRNLPRTLRFDMAHTFENSITFRRQRNMLAVKYYHLRALVHRHYLSPTRVLQDHTASEPTAFHEPERSRVRQCTLKCVSAAQQTARLLHNLEDKQSLVHGFPWWQMISCLICASSILFVASICIDREQEPQAIDWAAVEDDADVCLTVLDAFTANNNAARLATEMMRGLKETRLNIQAGLTRIQSRDRQLRAVNEIAGFADNSMHNVVEARQDIFDSDMHQIAYGVAEPVLWSSQFVDVAYNPFANRTFTTFDGYDPTLS